MRNLKRLQRFVVLVALFALFTAAPDAAAQQTTTITATGSIDDPSSSIPLTITFPPAGGAVTGSASYQGVTFLTMTGTFAGGDGGAASGTFASNMQQLGTATGSWSGKFMANGTGSGTLDKPASSCGAGCTENAWHAPWQVTFPAQEFQAGQAGVTPPQVEATLPPTPSCSPQVRGLSPSKPGDVISPGASYFDTKGTQVGIIQERWFLNGLNSSSVVWDGKQVQVEVQWTCLDHTASSQVFIIPAYQEQPPAAAPPPESAAPVTGGGAGPFGAILGAGAVLAGAVGAAAVTGITITQVIKGRTPKQPVPPGPRPTPRVLRPMPASPSVAPRPGAPPLQPEPGPQVRPPKKGMTAEEKARLVSVRGEMQAQINDLKDQWRKARDAAQKLNKLKKKDMIKFIFKKGWETKEWILNSPVEVINKLSLDPVMDKLGGKHDTSQDAKNIVEINNRIQSLNTEMQQAAHEVKYLSGEIGKINQSLVGGGG